MKSSKKSNSDQSASLLGLGLDCTDDQTRLTRGKNFVLYGGSSETHGKMQEVAIKVNEQLDKKGKRLEDVTRQELTDILHKAVGE